MFSELAGPVARCFHFVWGEMLRVGQILVRINTSVQTSRLSFLGPYPIFGVVATCSVSP